jgi:tetratricopeptide (TPR) repeat protein
VNRERCPDQDGAASRSGQARLLVFMNRLLASILALSAIAFGQGREPQRWAIIIGISKYAKLPAGLHLRFAERDAALLAAALREAAGLAPENIKLITGPDATAEAIKAAIGNWLARRASEQDAVYIFFSGHGLLEAGFGEAYLLAYDSDPQNPYATAISANDLRYALSRRIKSSRVIMMVDALRQDFFDQDASVRFARAMGELATSRSGLSIILSSSPGEFSREGQRWGGYGVFTKVLVDGIRGAADRDQDGSISQEEVFEYLASRLAQETSNKQHPWRAGSPIVAGAALPEASPGRVGAEGLAASKAKTAQPPLWDIALQVPAQSGAPIALSPEAGRAAVPPPPRLEPILKPKAAPPAPVGISAPIVERAPAPISLAVAAPPPKPILIPPAPARVSVPAVERPPILISLPKAAIDPGVPPKPAFAPPAAVSISVPAFEPEPVSAHLSAEISLPSPPSPFILLFEVALAAGQLIAPEGSSAWDIYMRLDAGDRARLKDALAGALERSSRAIIFGDIRSDSLSSKVEDFKLAGQMLSRLRALGVDLAALEKLSAAYALIALQFYDEAERIIAGISSAHAAAAQNALGLIHQGRLDFWMAERAFRRAIEIDQNWVAPRYNLALLLKKQGRSEALAELERAAELDPKNLAVLIALGDEYFARQIWPRAIEAYRRAISLSPNDADLHSKLGHALYSQGLRQEAEVEYRRAKELTGKRP